MCCPKLSLVCQPQSKLDIIGPSKMVRPFEYAVNALAKTGDVSEPVETQFGYHIIRLDERHPVGVKPFDEVRPQVMGEARAALLNQARREKVSAMIKGFKFESIAIESLSRSIRL